MIKNNKNYKNRKKTIIISATIISSTNKKTKRKITIHVIAPPSPPRPRDNIALAPGDNCVTALLIIFINDSPPKA